MTSLAKSGVARALPYLGATAAVLMVIGSARADSKTVGTVEKAQGPAQALQAGVARDLAVQGPVLFRDKLRTGADARLEAKLADDTVLTLGANGKMTVDEFVYDPNREGGKLALSVPTGAFLFVGGKVEGRTGGNVSIKTPVGTLGVRGTTVWGGRIDGGFGVLVLHGEVVVHTRHGAVTMKEGQGTMIYGNKGPTLAQPWPEDRVKRAVATISFDASKQAAAGTQPADLSDGLARDLGGLAPQP